MRTGIFRGDHRVTSPYGWRTHPITGKKSFHNGVDFSMVEGTELLVPPSFNKSRVRLAQADKYGGKYIQLERLSDGKGYYNLHVKTFKKKVGDIVYTGDVIALSGNTGLSTAAHTHVGVQKDADVWDSHEDPMPYIILGNENMKIGTKIEFLDNMNIRDIPDGKDIGDVDKGSVAKIVAGPRKADGLNWYFCKWLDIWAWVADTKRNKESSKSVTNLDGSPQKPTGCGELEKQINDLTSKVEDLEEGIENAEELISEKDTYIEQLESNISDLEEKVELAHYNADEYKSEADIAQDKYENLKKQVDDIEQTKNEAVKKYNALKNSKYMVLVELLENIEEPIMEFLEKLFGKSE